MQGGGHCGDRLSPKRKTLDIQPVALLEPRLEDRIALQQRIREAQASFDGEGGKQLL